MLGRDQRRKGTAGGGRLPPQGAALEARPQEGARERGERAGHAPSDEATAKRGGRRRHGGGEHEGQQQRRLCRRDVAPDDAGELHPEADEGHGECSQPGGRRDEGAQRDQERPDQDSAQIGACARRPRAAEVPQDDEREAAEGDERGDLDVADDQPGDGKRRGGDQCRARGAPQGGQAGIVRRPQGRAHHRYRRAPEVGTALFQRKHRLSV
jgi:hypothetical protein